MLEGVVEVVELGVDGAAAVEGSQQPELLVVADVGEVPDHR